MILAGVDVGVRLVTACMLHENGDAFWERFEAPARFDALKAARTINVLASRLVWPDVVWIERPFGRHIRSVSDLSRVVGALVSAIPARVAIDEIAPNEWKKLIGLPGNATKAEIMQWAQARCPDVALDQHQADALGIAVACLTASETVAELLDPQAA